MTLDEIETYDQLVKYLENWMSFNDEDAYDFNGMLGLFNACLKNINKYTIEGDFDEISDALEDSEKDIIKKLAKLIE
ncbi:MAG: hypothetical protein KZQ97_22100 [Candidatus Thiodiazotropha sp. (ex Dulcina madagascariensis)]|nr:hypothetical protein [Candidatus Thiodiazotropha sp. (ex Dulcina madagascariensis)]